MSGDNLREMEAAKQACDESEKIIYKTKNLGYSEDVIKRMIDMKKGDC